MEALSGTVVQTADLGLPALPSLGGCGGSAASFSSLVSGSHTLRVWYAGPDQARLALLGQLGESDLVRNGTDVWLWSQPRQHRHPLDRPAPPGRHAADPGARAAAMTPQQAADDRPSPPSTRPPGHHRPDRDVAGRAGLPARAGPQGPRSLVGSVRIAIDGATHVPLRVQVFAARRDDPAFEVGFTSLSTATPDASVFGFTPPPGATVKRGRAAGP